MPGMWSPKEINDLDRQSAVVTGCRTFLGKELPRGDAIEVQRKVGPTLRESKP